MNETRVSNKLYCFFGPKTWAVFNSLYGCTSIGTVVGLRWQQQKGKAVKINILSVIPRVVKFPDGEIVYQGVTSVADIKCIRDAKSSVQGISFSEFEFNVRWPISFQLQAHYTTYGTGSCLERHFDDILIEESQFRAVIVLRTADRGGELLCDKFILNLPRFKLFRPLHKHEVTKVEAGKRVVLLIGMRYAFTYLNPSPLS